jgi:hypothetical protein
MAQEEKRRHGGRTATVAAAAAVLLLAGGGMRSNGFGLLPNEGDSVLPEEGTTTVQEVVDRRDVQPEAEAEDYVLTVTVREDKLLFQGEEVSPEELEEALLRSYSTEKQVELVDDGAIKASYDTAAAILERLEIPYELR